MKLADESKEIISVGTGGCGGTGSYTGTGASGGGGDGGGGFEDVGYTLLKERIQKMNELILGVMIFTGFLIWLIFWLLFSVFTDISRHPRREQEDNKDE